MLVGALVRKVASRIDIGFALRSLQIPIAFNMNVSLCKYPGGTWELPMHVLELGPHPFGCARIAGNLEGAFEHAALLNHPSCVPKATCLADEVHHCVRKTLLDH